MKPPSSLPLSFPSRKSRLLPLAFALATVGISSLRAETIHVYLVGGQSNADGRAAVSELPANLQGAQTDVPFYSNYSGGLSTLKPNSGGTQFGPDITFGRSMADYFPGTSDFAVIKYAVGGTNLYSQWAGGGDADPTNDGSVYQSFETTIRAGLAALKAARPTATLVIDGIIWVQGESDIDGGAATSLAYGANLTNLIKDMRATFSPTMEFLYSRISDNQTVYSASNATVQQNYNTLRSQQLQVSNTVAGTKMLDIDGPQFAMNPDNLHFNATGQQALGNAFAAAAQSVLAPGFTATGVNWTGATDTAFATGSNWSGGAPANDVTTNFAVFSGAPTANQPAVTANRSVGGLQFGSTGGWTVGGSATLTLGSALTVGTTAYVGLDASALTSGTNTISTGTIQLATNQIWLVGTGGTLNVTSAVTGNALVAGDDTRGGTLILGGSTDNADLNLTVNNGTVKLDKASSSSVHAIGGLGLFVNGGTVQITGANGDQIKDGSPIVFNGGTFDLNGHTETIGGLSGSGGSVTNTSGSASALTVGSGTITTAFSGTIVNSGAALSLAKIGTGTQTLSGANTYTGTTAINGGTLLANGTHTGGGAYTVNSGGILGGNGTITTAGNAGITLASGGKLFPGSSNTDTNNLTLKLGTGTLDLTAAISGSNTGALVFNIGATADKLVLSTGTLAIGTGQLNFNDFTFVNLPTLAAGIYTLFDTTVAISGTLGSSLTGTVNGLNATLSLINSNNDIVLTLTGNPASYSWDTNGTAAGSGAATGTWNTTATMWNSDTTGVAAPIAVTTGNFDDLVFSAGSNGSAGTITVNGTQLANSIATNQPGLVFNGGVIALAGGGLGAVKVNADATINSGLTAKAVTFQTSGQTLKLGGGSTSFGVNATGTTTAIAQASTLELTAGTYSGSGTYNIGNVTTGTGGLIIDTGATFTAGATFQAGNGTTGLIKLNGGTINQTGTSNLVVGRGAAGIGRLILASGTLNHAGGTMLVAFQGATGTLDVQGGVLNATGTLSLNSPGTTAGAGGTAVINLSGSSVTTVASIAFGTGGTDFTGVANSGSGTLNVKGGQLYIGSGGIVKSGTGTYTSSINLSGGTIGATADWSSSHPMTLSNADGGVTFRAANAAGTANNISLTGALSGTGGLKKSGAGTLTLNGANTYTGDTVIMGGTLSINSAFLSNLDDVSIASGAIFSLNFAGADTIDGLYLNGVSQSPGTWGAVGSGANNISNFFTGTGVLNVTAVPESANWSFLGIGLAVFSVMLRRNARRPKTVA